MVSFFTSCKLPNDQKDIEKELEKTAQIRFKLLRNSASQFPKILLFYIVDPKLVGTPDFMKLFWLFIIKYYYHFRYFSISD